MDRLEIMSEIHSLANKLKEEDIKEVISTLQRKLYKAEDKYEDVEEIENLAIEVAIGARECFTYLVNSGSITKEQFSAFKNLAEDCDEFLTTFNFYERK